MSKIIHYFESSARNWAVALPIELEEIIKQWNQLRTLMIRSMPPTFTRDEWAYLVTFLDSHQLIKPFEETFGRRVGRLPGPAGALARPRNSVAVWLPGNVSLLGPLVLIFLSLTGATVRMKSSSDAQDLANEFLQFARQNLPEGSLKTYLRERVKLEQFDRADPRNQEMAAQSDARIVFGSDQAITGVESLPHPVHSVGLAFGDHVSQAWISPESIDPKTISLLIKVFAIYGQAGCTSPRRVIVLGGSPADAIRLRDGLCDAWPSIIPRDVPMNVASENIMAGQWAAATGWNVKLAPRNAAVLCAGAIDLPEPSSLMTLPICNATVEQALAALPANIQTIGHALPEPPDETWYPQIASSAVKRFVPLARMHHFGPTWDGMSFWRELFEEIEVGR